MPRPRNPQKEQAKDPSSQGSQREEGKESRQRDGKGPRAELQHQTGSAKDDAVPSEEGDGRVPTLVALASAKGGSKGLPIKGDPQKGGRETWDAALALVSRWDKGGGYKRDYAGEQAVSSKDGGSKTGFCECGCSKTCQDKPGKLAECSVCGKDTGSRCCWDYERNTCHNCAATPELRKREKHAAMLEDSQEGVGCMEQCQELGGGILWLGCR